MLKSTSKKLSVLCRLHQFFFPYQLLTLYRSLIRPCMEYAFHIRGGGCSTYTKLLHKVESKAFRLIDSPSPTVCLQPLTHHCNVASLAIFYRFFMLTALLNLLTECLPTSRGLATHDYLPTFIPILSTSIMKELTSIFTLASFY